MNGIAVPATDPARGPPAEPRPAAYTVDVAALLDLTATGVLVVDGHARLLYSNAAAARSLVRGDAGLSAAGGSVMPTAPHAQARWRQALRHAEAGQTLALRLDGPDAAACVSLGPAPGGPGVLCALPAMPERVASTLRAYAVAYGLTRAEAEVLQALVAGGAVKAIARRRGASESTVRTQVRSMLAKTGHAGLRALAIDALRSAPLPL